MGEAIECYHKALSLRPDDTFAQEMLTLALIDQCAVTMPPYNFVSYADASTDGGGDGNLVAPFVNPVATQQQETREEIDEDDDMEMSP